MSDERDNAPAPIHVRVLYFDGCPNHAFTVQRIRAVAERLNAAVDLKEIEVTPDDDPHRLKFYGSPTVQINGLDLDPATHGREDCGFGCRTYGGAGVPDETLIEAALTHPPSSNDRGRQTSAFGGDSQRTQVDNDCCSACGNTPNNTTTSTRRGISSSTAAFGSAVMASACCWLPLMLVGLGLSLSLSGLIGALHVVRPYLLILAGLCLAAGFYMVYFKAVPRKRVPQVALWTALATTTAMALFPYYSGALFGANHTSSADSTAATHLITAGANSSTAITLTYEVEGMTCNGCAAAVCSAMSDVPGVTQCRASYEEGRAWARVSRDTLERGSLVDAIDRIGFTAERITD